MRKNPLATIIVTFHNGKQYIKRCLDSLLQSETDFLYEVIAVDDGSTDSTPRILVKYKNKRRVKVLHLPTNIGPAKARNLAVKQSQAPVLIFIDVDCRVEKNAVRQLVQALLQNSKIGALQAKLIHQDKIESVGHFLSITGFPYEIGASESVKKYIDTIKIFGAKTAGMAIKREVFETIGGFDEDYFIYGEDTDISWRVWLNGYEIHFLPSASIYHEQKSSMNKKTYYKVFYEGAKNQTSNIIKNADLKILFYMLPLHTLVWLTIALKMIIKRKFYYGLMIIKGLVWNLVNINKTLKKRGVIEANEISPLDWYQDYMFGDINPHLLMIKGWRWFLHV